MARIPSGVESQLRRYAAALRSAGEVRELNEQVQELGMIVRSVEYELAKELAWELGNVFDTLPLKESLLKFRKYRGQSGRGLTRDVYDRVRVKVLVAFAHSSKYLRCVCVDEEGELQMGVANGRLVAADGRLIIAPDPDSLKLSGWQGERKGGWIPDPKHDLPIDTHHVLEAAQIALEHARERLAVSAQQLEARKRRLGI